MKNAQRAAAARMLKRAQALGLTTKTGSPVVIDLMEELMAAAAGHRNAHAWRASLETTADADLAPALEQVQPSESGSDYRLVNGRGCWVEVDEDFLAHVYLEPDGKSLVADLHAKTDAFSPLASATLSREDARSSFDEGALAPMVQQLKALATLGVEVTQRGDASQPGADVWAWTSPTDSSEQTFATLSAAVDDAWAQAGRSVCGMQDITEAQWQAAPLRQQCDWVRELAND